MIKLEITLPSEEIGFVEYKRSFCVEGNIISDEIIKDNYELLINVFDINNNIVRQVRCNKKYKDMYLAHPDLIKYKEELDPNLDKLRQFGFPLLVVDDIDNPFESLRKATIKAWYSDDKFKAIIVNASNVENGAIANDGLDLRDDEGKPYTLLEEGKYEIVVSLKDDDKVLAITKKEFIIGKRSEQLICRFNPISHKNRMIDWIRNKDIAIINDLIPGYLEPYLGKWYYHMGLLTMYRANDLCLFDSANIVMFNYLIDQTSTSYETELGYLESIGVVDDEKRMAVYYYDIGEASIDNTIAKTLKFNKNEYGHICRIDEVKNSECENKYYLDRRDAIKSHLNLDDVEVNNTFAIMGIIKPIQLDQNDFVLKNNNTYEMNDYPNIIRYTINGKIYDRYLNMERIESDSIGRSVFEFYNVFEIENEWKNNILNIKVDCIYKKGRFTSIDNIKMKVVG